MARNLGTIPVSAIQANVIDWSYFVRMDVGAPAGTQRFTDRPSKTQSITLDVGDGAGAQSWLEAPRIEVGSLDQGSNDILSVSYISMSNIDYSFTNWANSPGLRDTVVNIYWGQFDPVTGAFLGVFKSYEGRIDNAEYGVMAHMALKPHRSMWSRQVPYLTAKDLGAKDLMPAKGVTIYWGDVLQRNG